MTTLADYGAQELVHGYTAGDFSPEEVLDSVIERIEACEGTLNAFWCQTLKTARTSAQESTQRWQTGTPKGLLDGVPVTVKENIARKGIPMPSGTLAGTPVIPSENAPITDRLEAAGAVLLGSTVMPDWGMLSSGVSSRHGITRSPLNQALTTGGSSSGAGAAAAAGYGPIHIGTDIGGSIRLPGTWLGLATLKPSFGRVPLAAPYLGRCAGPMARRISDLQAAMSIIAVPDVRDYAQLPPAGPEAGSTGPLNEADIKKLRVAVHMDAGCGMDVDPEVEAVIERAARVFEQTGARVEQIEPFMNEEFLVEVDRFWRVRSWSDYVKLPAAEKRKVLPYIEQWCMAGADVPGIELIDAYNTIQEMRKMTVAATSPYDIVLSPVAPVAAFPAEWPMPFNDATQTMGHISFTVPYNMSEQPASSVHAGYTADGRTVGVQIAGHRFADNTVLAVADWFESVAEVPAPQRTVGA